MGLIGDVHAQDVLLDQALEFLQTRAPDALICTGDIADGDGDINRCCELLEANNVQTVGGNHDRWLLNDKVRHVPDAHLLDDLTPHSLAFLEALPKTHSLATQMGSMLLCHGMLDNDLAKIWPGTERMPAERNTALDGLLENAEYHLIVNGHVHYRTLIHFEATTLLNAGTLKQRHRPGFSELDFVNQRVTAFEFQGNDCVEVAEFSLHATDADRVWQNTQEFDGNWQPKVLYPPTRQS